MMKNATRLFLATVLCALLAGCNDTALSTQNTTSASADKPAVASSASSVMADVPKVNLSADAPIIAVVTTGKTRPFSFTEVDGSVTGMDVDVISKIGEAQGFRVQIHKRPWQNLFTDVEAGHFQIAISGISYTAERSEKYNLSHSYALNPSILMFTNPELEGKIKDLKSLKNIHDLTVGVLDGSKHMKQMTEAGITNLQPYKTTFLLFSGLLKGEVNVIAQDGLLLQQLAKEHPQNKTYTFTYEDEKDPSAQLVILMRKDNTELLQKVNDGLAKIQANGELEKIHAKWIGNEGATQSASPAK